MRHRFYLGIVVSCALFGLAAGCHHAQRPGLMSAHHAGGDGEVLGHDVVQGGDVVEDSPIPAEARAQHKATRRAGTWSDEAADIEASLGVPR